MCEEGSDERVAHAVERSIGRCGVSEPTLDDAVPGRDTTGAVAIVEGLYRSFAAGDVPAVVSALAPDVAWEEAPGFPRVGGLHRGVEAVLGVFQALAEDWEVMEVVPAESIGHGDVVVVLGETRGTARSTGRSFATPFAHVWRLQAGRVVGWRAILDTGAVRAAFERD